MSEKKVDKDAIIREFTEVVGKHFVTLFKLLELETHMEVMLRNDPTNEEWILSLKKIPHYLKDLDRDKKIESQSDELRQLREEKDFAVSGLNDCLKRLERSESEVEKLKKELSDTKANLGRARWQWYHIGNPGDIEETGIPGWVLKKVCVQCGRILKGGYFILDKQQKP